MGLGETGRYGVWVGEVDSRRREGEGRVWLGGGGGGVCIRDRGVCVCVREATQARGDAVLCVCVCVRVEAYVSGDVLLCVCARGEPGESRRSVVCVCVRESTHARGAAVVCDGPYAHLRADASALKH